MITVALIVRQLGLLWKYFLHVTKKYTCNRNYNNYSNVKIQTKYRFIRDTNVYTLCILEWEYEDSIVKLLWLNQALMGCMLLWMSNSTHRCLLSIHLKTQQLISLGVMLLYSRNIINIILNILMYIWYTEK